MDACDSIIAALFPLPHYKHLDTIERAGIVTLSRVGYNDTEIAKLIATSRPTVAHWRHHYDEHLDVADAPRSGRPRKLDQDQEAAVAQASTVDPFATPQMIRRSIPVFDVSTRTVARTLDSAGLHARVAHQAYPLGDEQKRDRLKFAEGYKKWTADDWRQVVFADEVFFEGEGRSGKVWVRRPDGTSHDDRYFKPHKPHPLKVAALGCISAQGPGYLVMWDGECKAKQLATHYREHIVGTFKEHFPNPASGKLWLLHDNDPRHRSPQVKTVLFNAGITALEFPKYSPDLNVIENVWPDINKRLDKMPRHTKDEFENSIKQAWAATSKELCDKLAASMPHRIAQCIERNGAYTDY